MVKATKNDKIASTLRNYVKGMSAPLCIDPDETFESIRTPKKLLAKPSIQYMDREITKKPYKSKKVPIKGGKKQKITRKFRKVKKIVQRTQNHVDENDNIHDDSSFCNLRSEDVRSHNSKKFKRDSAEEINFFGKKFNKNDLATKMSNLLVYLLDTNINGGPFEEEKTEKGNDMI